MRILRSRTVVSRRLVAAVISSVLAARASSACAQGQPDPPTETLTVRVVRALDPRTGTSTPLVDAMVAHVLQRDGRDTVLATAFTTITGDATLPLRRGIWGELRVRRIGFVSQRIALPAPGGVRPAVVRLLEAHPEIGEICLPAMVPVVRLQVRVFQKTTSLPLHVRIWTDRPRKVWADTIPELPTGDHFSLYLDAPVGQPFNIAVRTAGYRRWSRSAVVARQIRPCGDAGVVLKVRLRRPRAARAAS